MLATVLLEGSAYAQGPIFRSLGDQFPPEAAGPPALADFDGDGDVDVLSFFSPLSAVTLGTRLFANDGNARFTAQPAGPLIGVSTSPNLDPGNTPAYAVADVNGDGLPDLVSGSGGGIPWYWMRVWINQGGGVLAQSPYAFPLPTPANQNGFPDPRAIAAGDVDADGDVDLVVSVWCCNGWGFNQLELFLNNGNGSFVNATNQLPPLLVMSRQVFLRDLDSDWDLDIFVSDNVAGGWACGNLSPVQRVLWNSGNGVFSAPQTVPGPTGGQTCVALADLDGNGLPDLVYSPFQLLPSCTSCTGVSMNLGAGSFGPFAAGSCSTGGAIVAFDLNGGGNDEVIRFSPSGITVHSGSAAGLSAPIQSLPISADAGQVVDIDSDGDLDVVITSQASPVNPWSFSRNALLLNAQGTLVPVTSSLFGVPEEAAGVLGDVDGDGDVDYVGAHLGPPAGLTVALNDGSGDLVPALSFCAGGCPPVLGGLTSVCGTRLLKSIFPLDVDGNGLLDLYISDGPPTWPACGPAPGQPDQLFVNTGGAWTPALSLPASTGRTTRVDQGDLNGDGRRDLVIGRTNGEILIVFNLGAQGWAAPVALPPFAANDWAVFDAEGDGDLDILEVASSGSVPYLLRVNAGNGAFTPSLVSGLTAGGGSSVVAGDVDGDGEQDLIHDNVVYANTAGGVSYVLLSTLPSNLGRPVLFDADGDGDLDLGAYVPGSYTSVLMLNNGVGVFGSSQQLSAGLMGVVLAGDLDRDGDVDLVVPGPRVLTNVTRQISRASILRPARVASLDLFGPALGAWALFGSSGTGLLQAPPIGTVLLDLTQLQSFGTGTFSPAGTATLSTLLPPWPALLGVTVYLQALVGPPAHVTNLEIMTVLGV